MKKKRLFEFLIVLVFLSVISFTSAADCSVVGVIENNQYCDGIDFTDLKDGGDACANDFECLDQCALNIYQTLHDPVKFPEPP